MNNDDFDYDVFLSFTGADEEVVRPIWQKLSSNGLRVFWSDAVLKTGLGESWFDAIESALERSKHFLLIWTPSSMSSEWVRKEYQAFYSQCYKSGKRRLIPLLVGLKVDDLPFLLRNLEACELNNPGSLDQIIRAFGGENAEGLRRKLHALMEENKRLHGRIDALESELKRVKEEREKLKQQPGVGKENRKRFKTTLSVLAAVSIVSIISTYLYFRAITKEAITLTFSSLVYLNCGNVRIEGYAGMPANSKAVITRLSWNWDDGEFSENHPFPGEHRYKRDGVFTVRVTAYASNDETAERSITAIVKNASESNCQ